MMTESKVYVDTGAFFALQVRDDAHHEDARTAFLSLLKRGLTLVTSNLIVAETFTLLRVSRGYKEAQQFLEILKNSPRMGIIFSEPTLEEEACAILRKFSDHPMSYADGVSFAIMNRLQLTRVFAFDVHFRIAGFYRIPLDGM